MDPRRSKTMALLTPFNLFLAFAIINCLGGIILEVTSAPMNDEELETLIGTNKSNPRQNPSGSLFSPIVTATCRTGIMTIKVESLENFSGVVHSRDFRKPECSGYGENTKITFLRVNMLAEKDDKDYCGVFYNQPDSDERSVAVAVRTHRTLELVDDKFYMITCGKAGFQNSRNQTSLVNLQLLQKEKKVEHVVYGREYTLRADISHPDGQFGMKVKRCFSFSDTNNTVELVDSRGCPDRDLISDFTYDLTKGTAEAMIFSMFKFPESHRIHFQCDILVCRDQCPDPVCNDTGKFGDPDTRPGRSLRPNSSSQPRTDALFLQPPEDGALMASYSVFVLEPGANVDAEALGHNCDLPNPPWLLYLCIAFGVLFLLMLIVNIFLCSAMTCSCAKSDVTEKEQSMIEDFDPYTRSWHGSQYGSRYSLSNGLKPIPPPLISVDTSHSLSSSAASDYGGNGMTAGGGNGLPAVYGVPVHSRPSSRYSNRSHRSHRRPHQIHSSSSGAGSHYSKYSNGRILN